MTYGETNTALDNLEAVACRVVENLFIFNFIGPSGEVISWSTICIRSATTHTLLREALKRAAEHVDFVYNASGPIGLGPVEGEIHSTPVLAYLTSYERLGGA
jgi:hypothetical protein